MTESELKQAIYKVLKKIPKISFLRFVRYLKNAGFGDLIFDFIQLAAIFID